jgi:hypothetical protein
MEEIALSNTTALDEVVSKLPTGRETLAISTKIGLWTAEYHKAEVKRRKFPENVSALGPNQLSDQLAYWTSEFGRITELIGFLNGQREIAKLRLKSAKARSRSKVREERKSEKLTSTALNDIAEEDSMVLEIEEGMGTIEVLLAQVSATKEATAQYLASISREISYRDAQMKAKIY